jgi:predicted metalloprotease
MSGGKKEEALSAASAVGDDKIQKKAQGYIVPDGFTHGTSQQRMYWFKTPAMLNRGILSGNWDILYRMGVIAQS